MNFEAEFPLDTGSTLGQYTLQASKQDCGCYSTTFQVAKFKLEKIKLALDTDHKVYYRGDIVKRANELDILPPN